MNVTYTTTPRKRNDVSPPATSTTTMTQAALHRDGEQARIIAQFRQPQLQVVHHEETSMMQWINDSFWELWDGVFYESHSSNSKVKFDRHEHYADIVNPYREARRSGGDGVDSILIGEKRRMEKDYQIVNDAAAGAQEAGSTKPRRLPLRIFVFICQKIYHVLRCAILKMLNRLVSSDHPYNATKMQSYTIQFNADDVIKSFVLLWIGFKLNLWLQRVTASVLIVMAIFGFVFRHKMDHFEESTETTAYRESAPSRRQQQQHEQSATQQLSHQSQDISQRKSDVKQTTTAAVRPAAKASISQPPESIIHSDHDKPQHLQAIHRLKTRYPNATHAECKRFYVCVKHKEDEAVQRIESWLQWRSDCGLKLTADTPTVLTHAANENREYNQQFIDDDQEIWNEAATLAIQLENNKGIPSVDPSVKLPQILCAYEPQIYTNATTDLPSSHNRSKPPPRSKDSSRILHILPARIDITLAPATTYSLACALYLDQRLCRTTTEKITLLCDVRGGRGWANPTPWSMLPFIQCTSSLLGKHYPERLSRFVLFPMPNAAAWIWSAAQKCLDPNTASKVVVVGEEKGKKGLPERMLEFFDIETLRLVEERRRGFMHPSRNVSEECVRAMLSC